MPDLQTIGRWMLMAAAGLAAAGGLLILLAKSGLPLLRLPGDLGWQAGNLSCLIPLGTSLLLSVLLTLLINLILRFFR